MNSTEQEKHETARRAYEESQILQTPERVASQRELDERSENWKDGKIPDLQRTGVEIQLENLARGSVDPVFASLALALKKVELPSFSLLDAACASGYYQRVIAALDSRTIAYAGCDYSEAMVESARTNVPGGRFEVQDLTKLSYGDDEFDVVLLSGVLEHIPRYEAAIAQACRVARHYVVVHRAPFRRFGQNKLTVGTQYNIETPRIFFSRSSLVGAFEAAGRRVIWEGDTYERQGIVARMKRPLRRHTIRTLVFE